MRDRDLFLPTDSALLYVQDRIDPRNCRESIQQLFNSLSKTHRELKIAAVEHQNAALIAKDYVAFPRLDIIREMTI
jgi:hypothetical protein